MNYTSTYSKLLFVALFSCLCGTALASTTWYVDGVHGSNGNNCKAPASACKTIGHAVSLASSGDTIMVAAATYSENLTISKSLKIIGSSASATIIDGGGVATVVTIPNTSAHVILAKMTIRNGHAHAGGAGGGVNNSGTLTITNSTVSGNVAPGLCFFLRFLHLWVCGGGVGGGIDSGGTLTLSNSTISGNGAYHGGGIAGSATLQNSIVANSFNGGNCSGTLISKGYNLSSDSTCNFNGSGDLNNTDPKLGMLGNYGGPTQTIPLLSGSPAIDAGNPSGCTDGNGHLLKTDQRGYPRPDKEETTGCDMGGYESQSD
jgi:hypothetical protein